MHFLRALNLDVADLARQLSAFVEQFDNLVIDAVNQLPEIRQWVQGFVVIIGLLYHHPPTFAAER